MKTVKRTLKVRVKDKHSKVLSTMAVKIGATFGKLTVVSRVGSLKKWNCSCVCGNAKTVKECDLLSGHTMSCGCGRTSKARLKNLKIAGLKGAEKRRNLRVGQRFGRLVLTSVYPTSAKCDCGKTKSNIHPNSLRNKGLQSCGCLRKELAIEKLKVLVVNHRKSLGRDPNTPMDNENKTERGRFAKTIVPVVLKRDDFTCNICGRRGVNLHVHHKKPWSTHVVGRFNMRNLVTLCKACHIDVVHQGNTHSVPDNSMLR